MPILTTRPNVLKHFDINVFNGLGQVYPAGAISSDQSRFVGKSTLYLTNGGIRFETDDSFNFGVDDFTIAWSEYITRILPSGSSLGVSGNAISFGGTLSNGERKLSMSSNGSTNDIASSLSLGGSTTNTWVDWEIGRKNGTFYIFKNGVILLTFYSALPLYYNASTITSLGIQSNNYLGNVYFSEFLVIKGTCLHTTEFTPITEPYTFSIEPLDGIQIPKLNTGSISHTVDGFLTASTRTGGISTPIRDAVLIGGEFTGERSKPIRQGSYGIQLGAKTKVKTVRQGVAALSETKAVTKVVVQKPAKVIPYRAQGKRSHLNQGILLRTFTVDSNASNKFNVIVNATHQYKTQTITVNSTTTQSLVGQWSFSVGSSIVIPPSTSGSLNSITFSVDPTKLGVGKNKCSLNFAYADGTTEFVPLLITKEPIKRTSVERTFKNYDGGYTLNNVVFRAPDNINYVAIDDGGGDGTLTTTDTTSVSLVGYGGVDKITVVEGGCRFLLSFDGRNTWNAFNGTSWDTVNPLNIKESGMSGTTVNSLTRQQYATIFKKTALDFMTYIDTRLSGTPRPDSVTNTLYGTDTMYGNLTLAPLTYVPPPGMIITQITFRGLLSDGRSGYNIWTNLGYYTLVGGNGWTWNRKPGEILTKFEYTRVYGIEKLYLSIYGVEAQAYLSPINITLPANLPPSITNVSLTPSTLHSGNAILTGTVSDPEGDDVQYRVTINTDEIIPRTDFEQGPAQIEATISADSCSVGTNAITIEATDGDKISTPYTTYLTRTNFNPNITGILTGKYLNAVIGDQDGDQIKYRILVNNIVKQDWSLLTDSPAVVKYTIPKSSVIVGSQNKVTIEAIDSLGGTGNCDFDFVGQYYGLMFSDETGNYYSDDAGNTLRTLDLGSFLIGRSSNIQAIVIKNTTGVEIKDIIISADIDSLPDGVTVRFGLTESSFEDLSEAAISVALGYNDEYTIYVKVTCDEEEAVGNSILKLNAIGVIAQ